MKFGVKHILGAVAGLAMAGLASAASATPVTYDLTLVPTLGSTGGTGFFTIDEQPSFLEHYTVSNGGLLALEFNIDGNIFDLSNANTFDPEVDLLAGNAINILYNSGYLFFGFDFGSALLGYGYLNVWDGASSSGYIIVTRQGSNDVPEPLTLALVGAGLAGMGAMRKRKAA